MLLNRFSQSTILEAILELLGPEAQASLSKKCEEIEARTPKSPAVASSVVKASGIWKGRDKPDGLLGGI